MFINFSADSLLHFYNELVELLEFKPRSRKYNKFITKTFIEIAKEYDFGETDRPIYLRNSRYIFSLTPFVDLSNAINSGEINFNDWVYAILGEYIKSKKIQNKKEVTDIAKVKNIIKLYTVNEIKKQFNIINNMSVESAKDPFAFLTGKTFDLYKVDNQQKNKLYEMVINGELNFYFYVNGLEKNKFTIDEKKIEDEDFKHFIKLMHIIRHNKRS